MVALIAGTQVVQTTGHVRLFYDAACNPTVERADGTTFAEDGIYDLRSLTINGTHRVFYGMLFNSSAQGALVRAPQTMADSIAYFVAPGGAKNNKVFAPRTNLTTLPSPGDGVDGNQVIH